MNWPMTARIAAIAIGATVMFGLSLGLGQAIYIAIPAGIFVYSVVRVGFALLAPDKRAN